jgi:hypothetical protein
MFGNMGTLELLMIGLIGALLGALLVVVPYWFIFRKAGFHPALSLLMIIPLVGVIMRFYLAFADWPSLKRQDN